MKMRQNRLAEGKENKPAAAAEPAKKRTVPSGVIWFTVGNSMQAGTTVLMTMLTGYVLDLASVGIFSFALMASQLLYTVGLFGANDLQMTDYDHRYRFGDYFKVKVVSTLAAMLICKEDGLPFSSHDVYADQFCSRALSEYALSGTETGSLRENAFL